MSRASPWRSRVSTGSASALWVGLDFLISLAPHQVRLGLRDKVTVGLALAHHFLTIGVERIIHDPLGGVLFVIILEAQVAEALGDRLQSRSLGLVPERVVGIRTVDDLA